VTFKLTQSFNGARLRSARLAKRLTMRDLAEKLGVNSSQIARWESGKHLPHRTYVLAMAKLLSVKVRDLDEVQV